MLLMLTWVLVVHRPPRSRLDRQFEYCEDHQARGVQTGYRAERLERRSVSVQQTHLETRRGLHNHRVQGATSVISDQNTPTFGGIDWATDDHSVCVVDAAGNIRDEFVVDHTEQGLLGLCRRLISDDVRRVAIERPDGPVVDALMESDLEVVVVVSRSVKAFRERYATSGAKSDRGDAYVLADCLRSDGHRWASLQPDTPATTTLRSHVRTRRDLVITRVSVANQLRAHLQTNLPGAVGLFSDLDGQVSRKFLRRFPTENESPG